MLLLRQTLFPRPFHLIPQLERKESNLHLQIRILKSYPLNDAPKTPTFCEYSMLGFSSTRLVRAAGIEPAATSAQVRHAPVTLRPDLLSRCDFRHRDGRT